MTKAELYEELRKHGIYVPSRMSLSKAIHYAAYLSLLKKTGEQLIDEMEVYGKTDDSLVSITYGPDNEYHAFLYAQKSPRLCQ